MPFEELLENLRFEYYAIMAATCQDDQMSSLLDHAKVEKFPAFYEFLLSRGFNRWQLSAHGIGKGIS